MADISKIKIGASTYDVKDTTARTTKADKADPAFTGTFKLGDTTMTEQQLSALLNLASANGVSF